MKQHPRCSKCHSDAVYQNLLDWTLLQISGHSADHSSAIGETLSILLCGNCARDLLAEGIAKYWGELEKFSGHIDIRHGQIEIR